MNLKRSSYHRCSYHILIFIISHLWSGIDGKPFPGYSINVPHRVTVQRGLCVYIPCRFTVPETETLTTNAVGIWHNTSGHIVASNSERNNQFLSNGRFSLDGDVWRGDCSLYIEDSLHEDEGYYRFRVEDKMKFTYQDIRPYVEVTDLTDKPEISPIKSWVDGEEVTLTCTAPGRCKRMNPQITWEENIQNTRVVNWVTNHGNGTKTHSSTITFTARKELNNSTLSCIVQLREGLATVQQMTIKVESQTPQTVSEKNSYCKKTENHIECSCIVQSFVEASIRWMIDDKFYDRSDNDIHISTSKSDSVITSMLNLQLPQKDVQYIKCISSNKFGDLILDLLYKKCKYLHQIVSMLNKGSTLMLVPPAAQIHLRITPLPHHLAANSEERQLVFYSGSMDYQVIVGIVTGNIIILFLIAFGNFWFMKRHMKKNQGNNDLYELGDAKGPESVYQDLQRPSDSIYNTLTGSQQ